MRLRVVRALETASSAVLLFEVDQMLEELACSEASLLCDGDDVVEAPSDMAEPEGDEAIGQLAHDSPRCLRASLS
jgi:hypothetical protein